MPAALAPHPGGRIGRVVLPVSGIAVALLPPTGWEDLLLNEYDSDDDAVAVALMQPLTRSEDNEELAWPELTPTDLDAVLLRLRQALVGDRIVGDLYCRRPDCGSHVDIAFSIEAYLAHNQPKRSLPRRSDWQVASAPEAPGWFTLVAAGAGQTGATVRFRLPTVADQIAARRAADPAAAFAMACIDPPGVAATLRRRIEQALEAMAPLLSSELQGQCPNCGSVLSAGFEPRRYCLQEMRERARFVYADVDALARRYHWAEERILAMPSTRRTLYADLAAGTLM